MGTTTISKTTARRLVLGRQGLWPGRRWAGQEGTAEALRIIEEVQMDPRPKSRYRAMEPGERLSSSLS